MGTALARPSAQAIVYAPWWEDPKQLRLVRHTAFKSCDDLEFDEAVAVARDLNLSPLRKQLYAFVFSPDDPKKRNMVLVVGIDGARAVAARTGNYRPDNRSPEWIFDENAKNPLTNPLGIVSCTVGAFHRPTRDDPFERIVHTVFWDEFSPIIKAGDGDDDYEWIETGETWPDSGKPKKKKRLRQGADVVLRLDPKKDAWIKSGRNQIAKCAEMGALRKGWPEDLSRVYSEEETHRAAATIEADYVDLTPSEAAAKADQENRLEKLGGGQTILVQWEDHAPLAPVPVGQFFDRAMEFITKHRAEPSVIARWRNVNRHSLKTYWALVPGDALELKKVLESIIASEARDAPH